MPSIFFIVLSVVAKLLPGAMLTFIIMVPWSSCGTRLVLVVFMK